MVQAPMLLLLFLGVASTEKQSATVLCAGDICPLGPVPRIGVVGAGIGGASAAYFIHRGEPLAEIHLFEKEAFVGGRVHSTVIEGAHVEVGASIYHVSNRYFDEFVNELGLKRVEPPNLGLWGLWDGSSFVIQESEWRPLTLVKILYRYGLAPFRVDNLASQVKDSWIEVYGRLENTSYATSKELLDSLGVSHLVQQSLLQALKEGQVVEEYIHELVTAIERVNYGQSPVMNAFAGFVGLVGSGKETLFSVDGGNGQVVEKLIKAAKAELHLRATVSSINTEGESKYKIKYNQAGQEHEEIFDAVVIATPLELTDISFLLGKEVVKGGLPQAAGKKRAYQTTHATLVVASELKRSFFGATDDTWIPSFVLTTENPNQPFNSASAIRKLNETHNIYKIFSRQEVSEETLDRLFNGRLSTFRKKWDAYPVLTPYPFEEWPRIKLQDGLYYANAFESAVSCMETQIASARNVANLLLHDLI